LTFHNRKTTGSFYMPFLDQHTLIVVSTNKCTWWNVFCHYVHLHVSENITLSLKVYLYECQNSGQQWAVKEIDIHPELDEKVVTFCNICYDTVHNWKGLLSVCGGRGLCSLILSCIMMYCITTLWGTFYKANICCNEEIFFGRWDWHVDQNLYPYMEITWRAHTERFHCYACWLPTGDEALREWYTHTENTTSSSYCCISRHQTRSQYHQDLYGVHVRGELMC